MESDIAYYIKTSRKNIYENILNIKVNYVEMLNYNFVQKQKEACAIITMRDMLSKLAIREKISYKEALFLFTSSNIYEALFDFDTGI